MFVFVVGSPLAAGSQTPTPLRQFTARLSEPFAEITSVRELSDGRVLIGDRQMLRIVVGDLARDRQTLVTGEGVLQYGTVNPFIRIAGDSTIMRDGSPHRGWLVFDGARIVRIIPMNNPALSGIRAFPEGADTLGNLFARLFIPTAAAVSTWNDSATMVRVRMSDGRADTVTRLRPNNTDYQADQRAGERPLTITLTFTQLDTDEQAAMFPDGWIAVARLQPYRVDWRSPDGTWTLGAPLPFTEIAVDPAEQQAFVDRWFAERGREPPRLDRAVWSATVPPFRPDALVALPDGNLLIARTATASIREHRYDIVDRSGKLKSQISLALNERIVGSGRGALYVAWRRSDGKEELHKHSWQ